MPHERQVYLLDPQKLAPETIAVTFAKTSRSPESFQQIAAELTNSKSAEFNEKWVVGYGHSSVAEHAVLHIAVENISRLAVECLESNRLASYTEKSTRYQTWNTDAFYVPEELKGHPLEAEYLKTCQILLETYQQLIPLVNEAIGRENPQSAGETSAAWERRVRSLAIDVCRFLLPAASLANVGVTINARALEHALTKMLSHPLAEVRRVGTEIKSCAMTSVPTLLKYANADEYLSRTSNCFSKLVLDPNEMSDSWCQLVSCDPDIEERILAAELYKQRNTTYTQCLDWAKKISLTEKKGFAQTLLDLDDKHSIPFRELEHANFTFDVLLDQGAYYEVKRHRMMTLTPQALTADLGYAIPIYIEKADALTQYSTALKQAQSTYNSIHKLFPEIASYIVPNAYNRRFIITTNLRSLIHFIKLRSAPNAHFSVRRLAQKMLEELTPLLPTFSDYISCNKSETVASIEKYFFCDTLRR
jgi:thymidylate synthase ThyX